MLTVNKTMFTVGEPIMITAYELQFSLDGQAWETVISDTDMNVVPEKLADAPEDWSANDHVQPVVYELEASVHAQYFRIRILEHGREPVANFNNVPMSELGEIELLGVAS